MDSSLSPDSMDLNGGLEWIPRIRMKFETTEEAWQFWVNYAGKSGFNARKFYNNVSRKDNKTTSVAFVCSNEGFRCKDKRDDTTKRPRLETRTGCPARLVLKLNRELDKFEITEFISEHNHMLQLPEACHFLPCQRKVTKVAAIDIDLAENSGIRPKLTHELMGRQAGGIHNGWSHSIRSNNYLRDKRKETLVHGEAVSILRYFCEQAIDNPSFQHAEQIDDKQEISNIFWADTQMIIDYAHFGDVVIFDTTHGTNKEFRPFGVFVGLNQFREIVIFGAVLLYDQTIESFEWVFRTFLNAHNNKQPRTIFTDQDAAMGVAIVNVMPTVTHGLCTWHITENAKKHLTRFNDGDTDYVGEFRACVYNYEEGEFEKAFTDLESKLKLPWHFERVVADKRHKEVKSEFDYRLKVLRLKLETSRRNRDLCRKFVKISAKASTSEEMSSFLDGVLGQADKQIDEKMRNISNTSTNIGNASLSPDVVNVLTENLPHLKKRSGLKGGKRKESWVEKMSKTKRTSKQSASTSKLASTSDKENVVSDPTPNSGQGEQFEGTPEGYLTDETHTSFTSLLTDIIGKENVYPSSSNMF